MQIETLIDLLFRFSSALSSSEGLPRRNLLTLNHDTVSWVGTRNGIFLDQHHPFKKSKRLSVAAAVAPRRMWWAVECEWESVQRNRSGSMPIPIYFCGNYLIPISGNQIIFLLGQCWWEAWADAEMVRWVVEVVVAGKESMDWKGKEFKFLTFIVRGF